LDCIGSECRPAERSISPYNWLLVVDDNEAVLDSLKFALQLEGFVVRLYSSGDELLKEPDVPQAGCLLIDYYMPGMTGLGLLAELRRRKVKLPALLMTGHPSVAVRREAAEAGILLLEKPLLGNGLINAIRDAMAVS
jgi:two-component system, LuxR family, response regulator FixJ